MQCSRSPPFFTRGVEPFAAARTSPASSIHILQEAVPIADTKIKLAARPVLAVPSRCFAAGVGVRGAGCVPRPSRARAAEPFAYPQVSPRRKRSRRIVRPAKVLWDVVLHSPRLAPGVCRPLVDACRPLVDACRPLVDACRPLVDACRPRPGVCRPLVDACRPRPDEWRPAGDGCRPLVDACRPRPDRWRPVGDLCGPLVDAWRPRPDGCRPLVDVCRPRPDGCRPVPSSTGRVPSPRGHVPSPRGRVPSSTGRVPVRQGALIAHPGHGPTGCRAATTVPGWAPAGGPRRPARVGASPWPAPG